MAVASSIVASDPMQAAIPASRYPRIIAGPIFSNATPGRIKIPELIMAPVAMQNTSRSPSVFNNSFFIYRTSP